MIKIWTLFAFCFIAPAVGESFLKATQFPKDIDDLSFEAKMDFLEEVYEPYAAEYDKDGFCVKNCAYPGLNIKQEEYIAEQDTQEAIEESEIYEENFIPTEIPPYNPDVVPNGNLCKYRNPDIPVGQQVPWGEPLRGKPQITSQFGQRIIDGKIDFHDAIDYAAKIGTIVYAPAGGRVVFAGNKGNCGKMVQIKHNNGIQTIYCHLNEFFVHSGQWVDAGCSFATTGNTGHSTGPHLHYAMRNANNEKINPAAYTGRGK